MHIVLPPIDSAFDSPLAYSDSFVCQRNFIAAKRWLWVVGVLLEILVRRLNGARRHKGLFMAALGAFESGGV
jgi:hypothetical protein